MVNGLTEINLTKLDCLSGFEEVKIGVQYVDSTTGEVVTGMPASLTKYANCKVTYESMPGWTEDISKMKTFAELPATCQAYVKRLEALLGMQIRWIGVGAGRLDLIDVGALK
jgi:adenylosuccinate synthase